MFVVPYLPVYIQQSKVISFHVDAKIFVLFRSVDMEEVKKFFPKAKLDIIPGASHFVHTNKPHEFLEAVHKFLS